MLSNIINCNTNLSRISRGRFVHEITRCDLSRQEVYGYRVLRVDLNAKGRPLSRVNNEMV